MNTHAEYRRHSYRPPERPSPAEGVEPTASELARHRDPSLGPEQPAREQTQKRIAWVRPTELGSYLGPTVGRGDTKKQLEIINAYRATLNLAPFTEDAIKVKPPAKSIDLRLVDTMARHGFTWGGRWQRSEPGRFEWMGAGA